jgi:hypothetical protein
MPSSLHLFLATLCALLTPTQGLRPAVLATPTRAAGRSPLVSMKGPRYTREFADDVADPTVTTAKWFAVQTASDLTAFTVLVLGYAKTEGVGVVETVQLLWGTPVAFWVIVGPAIMTAGGVWRRITGPERGINGDDGSGAKFEEDFLVERLGGAEPVRKLRASVSAALTVEAKPLPEWQRNMGATGKK